MRLSSLEIQGFKSFPDKTRLTFDHGITAVVGPNGSGKSNIADAVRWVLGEQSTKTLRGNKMEDVIFGGTQTRKPVGYATVSLTIENSDHALPVDEDDITITRRLYRSGESEYRLNGAMVRLKDIHEMLMDTGLGRDGYSIIGQGRISEIVSSKPASRREIFEEAAGIAKFRYRKEEAERHLAQSEENLLRLRDILSELEGRVEPLRQQSEKAKSFLDLSVEKKSLEISIWMTSLNKYKEQLAAQQDKVYLCKNDYEQLEDEASAIESRINDIFDRSQQISLKTESLRSAVKELEEELARSESETAVMQNDIRHNETSVQRVDAELKTTGTSSDDLAKQVEGKRLALDECAKNLTYLDDKISAANDRLLEQKESLAKIGDEINSLTVSQSSISEAIGQIKLEKATGAGLIEESEKRIAALGENSGLRAAVLTELERNIAECEIQIEQQDEQISSNENMLKGYALKRQSRAAKIDELNKKAEELCNAASQKKQRAKLLEDMEAAMEGFGGSVKYILKQAKSGAISGVHGAVSSLIDTQSDYAVAIETALGAAMQNIVVENEDTAKRAIRMLQNASAGRATFLPLTSVKGGSGLPVAELKRYDGFMGAASQLVSVKDKFSGIVNQLLGRVAVVDSLDNATTIAKSTGYKYRIVTLDGQVINAGGSFTGGSTGKSSGVLGRRHEIERLYADAGKLLDDAEKLAPPRKAAIEELASIDAHLSGAEAEIKTAKEEKMRLGYELETLRKNLEQEKNNRSLAQKELNQLKERLDQLKGSEADFEKVAGELTASLDAVTEKLESANARRNTIQMGVETASQAIAEQKLLQVSAVKDHELISQEIERISQSFESAGTRKLQLETERENYINANIEITDKIEQSALRQNRLKQEILDNTAEITSLLQKRTELESATTGLRQQEKEVASKREAVSKELARLDEQHMSIQNEYDSIIAKLWDEYELTKSKAQELAQPLESVEKSSRRLTELRSKIKALGTVNVEAIEEYSQVKERYETLMSQLADVENAKAKLTKMIFELTQEMREIFIENFTKIANNFSKIFVQLFGGGKAELTLTREDDVLESGVEIFVQPPGKIIKNLALLSGGEQSFVAIAIYFAILKVRPAPFCLLDEIEAALDDVNVVRYATYLRQMCKKTQFIAITHRRGTMEEADVLYGVTMQDEGVSKLLNLNVAEVEEKLGLKNV